MVVARFIFLCEYDEMAFSAFSFAFDLCLWLRSLIFRLWVFFFSRILCGCVCAMFAVAII